MVESIVDALKYFLMYSRLFGVYPLKICKESLEASRVYSTVAIIIYTILVFLDFKFKYYVPEISFNWFVGEIYAYTGICTIVSMWFSSALCANDLQNIFEMYHAVDQIFIKHGFKPKYWLHRLCSLVWLAVMHVLLLIPIVLEQFWPLWMLTGSHRFYSFQVYFWFSHIIICNVACLISCAEYRFSVLNHMLSNWNSFTEKITNGNGITQLAWKVHPIDKRWNDEVLIGIPCARLEDLQRCHMLTKKASSSIASVFAWPLIFFAAHHFCGLLCDIFFIFSVILKGEKFDLNSSVNYTKWALVDLVQLIIMALPFSRCADKGNTTIDRVIEIHSKTSDPLLKKQLLTFEIQLSQPLQFYPLGLFQLDMGFVTSILGGVATYVMILLQLRPTSEIEENVHSWFHEDQ